MKKFITGVIKFAVATAAIAGAAIAIYRFCKKHVSVNYNSDEEKETEENADPAEETKSANRHYVNIVLDWDKKEEAKEEVPSEEKTDVQEDTVSEAEAENEAEASETEKEDDVQVSEDPEAQTSEPEENEDSSIHLD